MLWVYFQDSKFGQWHAHLRQLNKHCIIKKLHLHTLKNEKNGGLNTMSAFTPYRTKGKRYQFPNFTIQSFGL